MNLIRRPLGIPRRFDPGATCSSSAAKNGPAETVLTVVAKSDPPLDRRSSRRSFKDAEKLAIVLETEQPGMSVAAVCRQHDIATSMVFRWRIQFGFREKKRVKLAAVKLVVGQTGGSSARLVLHDLIAPPDGISASNWPAGVASSRRWA